MKRACIGLIAALLLFSCSREKALPIEGMVYIPAGEFVMGSEDVDTAGLAREFGFRRGRLYEDERPVGKVSLKGFYIDEFEVTNARYKAFVDAAFYQPPAWWENGAYPAGEADHPVTEVTWFDADAYCRWAGKRLPTEEEWEKAARGPDGNRYPWGNEYDEKKANLTKGSTMPAGGYHDDKSHYGVYDMGGNVREWTGSWYGPYPGNTSDNKDFGKSYRVLRGGAGSVGGHYSTESIFSRASFRHYYDPSGAGPDAGMRCAKDLSGKAAGRR